MIKNNKCKLKVKIKIEKMLYIVVILTLRDAKTAPKQVVTYMKK